MKHFSIEVIGLCASLVAALICLVVSIWYLINGHFLLFIFSFCNACLNTLLFHLQVRRI